MRFVTLFQFYIGLLIARKMLKQVQHDDHADVGGESSRHWEEKASSQ